MIGAVAVTLALATPSREALIERWLGANRTHTTARLKSAPSITPNATLRQAQGDTESTLRALAQRELGILGRYQLVAPPAAVAGEPWWFRAWDWIAQQWQKFWRAFFARVHVGREEAASIGDVFLVAIGLLLTFVVVRLLMNLQIARAAARASSTPLEELPPPRALYKQACSAASRGDYTGAALLLFAAMVALLARQGAVDAISSATVGDLRRELRARNAGIVASFDAVAAPFVQTAYAERAVDAAHWNRAHDAYVTLSASTPLSTGSVEG